MTTPTGYDEMGIDPEDIARTLAQIRGEEYTDPAGNPDPQSDPLDEGEDGQETGQPAARNPLDPTARPSRTPIQSQVGDEEPLAPPVPPVEQPPIPETITIDGRAIPVDVLRSMVSFDDFLKADPRAAARLRNALNPPQEVIPPPPPPIPQPQPLPVQPPVLELPPDIDLDEPANVYFATQLQEVRQENQAMRALWDAQAQERMRQEASQQMVNGIARFSTKYETQLTPDDIVAIRNAAVPVFPGMMERDGQNAEQATFDSLEYAMWGVPEIRGKLMNAQAAQDEQQQQVDTTRQRNLTALAGGRGSGNATSVAPPETPQGDRLALVRAVREGMAQSEPA